MSRIIWLALLTALVATPAAAQPKDATILVAGDLLGPYEETFDPADPWLARVAALVAGADAAFANQEGSSFDRATPGVSMAAENGGGYPIHSLATMRGLKALGIDLVSRANNHATDWGVEGMTATDRALDAIGVIHAGTGQSLTDARKPAVFAAPNGSRIALVATASSYTGMSPAGDPGRGAGPRPGLNPLKVLPIQLVTRREIDALASIVRRGGWQGYDLPGPNPSEVRVGDARYRVSSTPGLDYEVSNDDRKALLASVAAVEPTADLTLFSIHAHETLSGGMEDFAPPAFLPALFHDAVDRGADLIARHGPHDVQGIEIYKGRPIFYGLGHFFFSLPRSISAISADGTRTTLHMPDSWWEGAVATVRYSGGRMRQVRIYPLSIESADGPHKGWPALATGDAARRILERIRDRSKAYGTTVRIDGDTAVIDGN